MNGYIELLQQMIAIPSMSGSEKAVADHLQRWIESQGMAVRRCGDNIWMESCKDDGSRPSILLNAHTDTVKPSSGYSFDPYCGIRDGDRILGLGSNDDGGSLVALLATYMRLSGKKQPYRLVFSATAEEETNGTGGIDMVKGEWGDISFGIIGEPTGMRMAVAEKGLLVLDCLVRGKSGHAARSEGINALYKALPDIEWFRTYEFPNVSEYLGPVIMNVTMIDAGTQHNVVPDSCHFVVDVRTNGECSNEEVLSVIRGHVSCEVTPRSMKHNCSRIDLSHPAVSKGMSMGLETYGSPTASNQTRCSFPTLKMGPGESERSHSADEFILVSEVERAVDIYCELLDGLII
ncbi:MAG: M20/M25/M40 family metallo-hydrolase [Bacteroidales bacterium]|nr:M20/M25/M40 family metallo-hydrolase [Bacteroidales bacterium]